jgi:AraC family transcriptional regulator, transcriptional activator of pobA
MAMHNVLQFDTVIQYNTYNNHETSHPLVSVVDLSKATCTIGKRMNLGIYTIFLKDVICGNLKYGNNYYDYQEGTLIFFAPGQVYSLENETKDFESKGYALVFHPDLIRGTSLGRRIHEYTFFSYKVNEALHLSEQERQIVIDCLNKIGFELKHAVDRHSKTLIVSNIELFLNYCVRFYDRQFITRETVHKGILERFEKLLYDYFTSDKPQTIGLPSVNWCAGQLHLSPNYFGDLVKKETGKSALDYIQSRVINVAKEKMFDTNKSVSEIAYELGFKYPSHFARFFKKQVGHSPHEYRTNPN